MKVEWLYEAQVEYRSLLLFYKTKLGIKYAESFAGKIGKGVRQLASFPESGVLRKDTLMGKHGFRALFIDQYVCVYNCVICGRSAEDGVKLHVDHIIPVSKGGKTELRNLRTLCEDCNLGKKPNMTLKGLTKSYHKDAKKRPSSLPKRRFSRETSVLMYA